MARTVLPSHENAVVATVKPDEHAAGAISSAWVPVGAWFMLMAIVQTGSMGAGGTVDFKIEQATDDTGTGAKDVDGKAVTQLTQAGGDSNKQAIIDLFPDALDINNGFAFVRITLTVGTAACDAAALLIACGNRMGKASDFDADSVAEIA